VPMLYGHILGHLVNGACTTLQAFA
jgi:hypothetical protein